MPDALPAAAPPPEPRNNTTGWLAAGALVHLIALVAVVVWMPDNEKLYALLAAQSSGFSGALLLRLKG